MPLTLVGITGQMTPPPPDHTSATLLLSLRQNGVAREVAWHQFYNLYQPMIVAFALRLGATKQEADELMQDIMLGFFRVSPEFQYDPARGRFRGYLKTCVCHKLYTLRTRRARDVQASASSALLDDVAVEATWNDVWETEKLHRAVALVRDRYSKNADRVRTFRAFEMCTLLDRPTDDVAAELGMTPDGVRTAKSRVSRALRQAFDGLDDVTG